MNQIICNAIHNKVRLSLSYLGVQRIVEPHAYGCTAKGSDVLRCYQTKGFHTSPNHHDWDLLTVSQIFGLRETEEHFLNARPGYKRYDSVMSRIYAQI